jgi:hypothetical protein
MLYMHAGTPVQQGCCCIACAVLLAMRRTESPRRTSLTFGGNADGDAVFVLGWLSGARGGVTSGEDLW